MSLVAVVALAPFWLSGIEKNLTGSWVGSLEYRDYSDNSRVKLGTLFRCSPAPSGFTFRYVYDDGPNKVVQDKETIIFDEAAAKWSVSSEDGKDRSDYAISKESKLSSDGSGNLVLYGVGTENGSKVDIRETLSIRHDRLIMLRESKLPGQQFQFRHNYSFRRP